MSATLRAAPIAEFLDGCRVLRSEGRLYEMSVRYRPHSSDPLEEQVRSAVEQLLAQPGKGDILVFLPGAAEIQRAARALEAAARRFDLMIAALHGDLSAEEQDRAVQPARQRKVILSTNVAESSVTIEGVTAVVDSGVARIASHSPWSGLPVLQVRRISQASAMQRAGRSARTAPGTVVRLYPEEDFLRRPHHDPPEIQRMDLAEVALTLEALGLRHFGELEWLDEPPAPAVEAAEELLQRLGALDEEGRLNATGRAMLDCPLPPRLARMVIEADRRGVGDDGALAAAVLSLGARLPLQPRHATPSDVFALMEGELPPNSRRLAGSVRNALRLKQTKRSDDDALRMAILAGFPDRVARRRPNDELLLSGGGSALLAKSSTVREGAYLVAIDIEDRKERGLPLVRLASSIEPDWLLDLFPERIQERSGVEWNRTGERVESVNALLYDGLVIDESRGGAVDPEQAARMLAAKAREQALHRFMPDEERLAFLARTAFAAQFSSVPKWTEEDIWKAIEELCAGKRSFAELLAETKDGGLAAYMIRRLPQAQQRALEELAPLRWKLPSGRSGRIEYIDGQAPKLSARLQEFFGMKDSPRIGGGKVALVLELLAPNQRPVQTTTDLAGFWQRWYPTVRKELMRRYPKHAWPEKPE
jgi:ATP-dependent helicase HrpB